MYLIIDKISRGVWTKEDITDDELIKLLSHSYRVIDIFDPEETLEFDGDHWVVIDEWDWEYH